MKLIIFILFAFAAMLVSTAAAEPLLPCEFSGDITLNGQPAPAGTRITAFMDSQERGSIITTVPGHYGDPLGQFGIRLAVTGYDGEQGHAISFSVNGFRVPETSLFAPGTSAHLNLTGNTIICNFTADRTYGPAPLTVWFTDTSTGSPSAWNWSFGDGQFSTLQHPDHTFMGAGNYTVSLNATNDGGSDTMTRTDYITVTEPIPAPVANFSANVTEGLLPRTIQFTDTSTGSPTSWYWDFGDINNSTLQNPVHVYTRAGNHTVSLKASNAGGMNTTVKYRYIIIYPKGDFNHNWEVDIGDVALVAYMVVGRAPAQIPDADFNNNGMVDIGDAAKIAWFVVGKIPEL